MMKPLTPLIVDFEAATIPEGGGPRPVCVVAHEPSKNRTSSCWLWKRAGVTPPFEITPDTVLVAYGAAMEITCFIALGWRLPPYVIDLFAEFRCATNGARPPGTNGLLDAGAQHGIKHAYPAAEKERLQQVGARGGPFKPREMIDYCAEDVRVTTELWHAREPGLDLPHALFRGDYVRCCGAIEMRGVPIDVKLREALIAMMPAVRRRLIAAARYRYPRVFDGESLSREGFAWWLRRRGFWWPLTDSGMPKTDADTFDDMVRFYPELRLLKHTLGILGETHALKLAVGADGRNRAGVRPFMAKTARNAPSTTLAIFGGASWQRSLIRPEPGRPIAYIDYSQQEFGIAAALSGDSAMMAAYQSGDAYMAFAIMAGAALRGATKATHAAVREIYKVVVVATMYGQSAKSLARRLNIQTCYAAQLLAQHWKLYPRYWAWSNNVSATFQLRGVLQAPLGWRIHRSEWSDNDLSVRNFPLQTAGSEILRVATVLAEREGVRICALVHDALLIESTDLKIWKDVRRTKMIMRRAGEIVLGGFKLRTDHEIVRWPNRYVDKRGAETWAEIRKVLGV